MAAEQRAEVERARELTEAERHSNAREQTIVVGRVGEGLEALAAGDLTYRLHEAFPPAYQKLQAASLEETAAALDEITVTVRKTAEGAGSARRNVEAARQDAEKGGEVVERAVAAMGQIEASSHEIGAIIGVIDEIAFQTNLLALNAGVEAARAGDAGKGFAVVAQGVRALAQRSAEAAKEIKTLISNSTNQVNEGVSLVGETGQALHRIIAGVQDLNRIVAEIAASANEQATGLHQVNTAVNQMDQATQQNAAMVEQSTAASHALSNEARQLGRLVERFRLTEDGKKRRAA
ncbi:methyl-accepting chemotaxis protein [Caulobacter sp. BE264]|nr:methyl-accepting chemotaxis protein [Caulobacter sp. BE264]